MSLNKKLYSLLPMLIGIVSCSNDANLASKYDIHYLKVKSFDNHHVLCDGVVEVICRNDKQALLFRVNDNNTLHTSPVDNVSYTFVEYGDILFAYKTGGQKKTYIRSIKHLDMNGVIIDYSSAHLYLASITEINIINKDVLDKEMDITLASDCNSDEGTHNTSVSVRRVDKSNNLISQKYIYPSQLCKYQSFSGIRP